MQHPDFLESDQILQTYKLLNLVKKFVNQNSGSQIPQVKNLLQVAKRLKVFGCQQLNFFQQANLDIPVQYPKEYIYALLHDQIGRDFSIIQNAVCQYKNADIPTRMALNIANQFGQTIISQVNTIKQSKKYVRSWDNVLSFYNRLAEGYSSEPNEKDAGDPNPDPPQPELIEVKGDPQPIFPKNTVVISYFRKFPSIRLIPYAPVALVGIPFTAVTRYRDLLATPHEIGHQVFWRWLELRFNIQTLTNNSQDPLTKSVGKWAEEIFADTFGVRSVGAAAALFAQRLESGFDLEHFGTDDGAHPVSSIRPFVHLKALGQRDPASAELSEIWEKYRITRTERTPYFNQYFSNCKNEQGKYLVNALYTDGRFGGFGVLEPAPASKPVDQLVELSLRMLGSNVASSVPQTSNLDDLFPIFENSFSNLPLASRVPQVPRSQVIDDLFRAACPTTPFNNQTWFDVVGPFIADDPGSFVNPARAIAAARWLPLMDMDAWADKGPTNNPRGD